MMIKLVAYCPLSHCTMQCWLTHAFKKKKKFITAGAQVDKTIQNISNEDSEELS